MARLNLAKCWLSKARNRMVKLEQTHHSPSRGRRADFERSTKGSGDSAPVVSARTNRHTHTYFFKKEKLVLFFFFPPFPFIECIHDCMQLDAEKEKIREADTTPTHSSRSSSVLTVISCSFIMQTTKPECDSIAIYF